MIEDIFARVWDQMFGRLFGPLSLRFFIQPTMALMLGIAAGVRDAREHRPPFLEALIRDRHSRRTRAMGGWRDISICFSIVVILDTIYQIYVIKFFYPLQTLAVACLLAVAPYVLVRGLVTRLLGRLRYFGGNPIEHHH